MQDLLSEKDTQISNLDATIRALEHEKYMVKTRLVQVEDAIVDERHRYADLERHHRGLEQVLGSCQCAAHAPNYLRLLTVASGARSAHLLTTHLLGTGGCESGPRKMQVPGN